MKNENINKYLPLTETTAYILLSLAEPLHGYALMQKVEDTSQKTVSIGPGTLYTAFSNLEKENLIVKVGEENRRKIYQLTEKGKQVIKEHIRRTQIFVHYGQEIVRQF